MIASVPSSVGGSVWKEYTDPTTGKVYFSNGVTTQWTRPTETEDLDKGEVPASQDEQAKEQTTPKKRKRIEVQYDSKDDAIAGFKELLSLKDIAPTLKWGEVVKLLSGDDRWGAAESHLSTGERKQTLAEYQTKRANELRTIQRQERQRVKESFQHMLAETLPSVEGFSAWNSNWNDVRDVIPKDSRYHLIDDESTRETLFVEFCEEYRKREDRRRRAMKREAESNFLSFLKELREKGRISSTTTWRAFRSLLDETERADTRIQSSENIVEAEQQHLFTDFMSEVLIAEEEDKRRYREERRKEEKIQRNHFHGLLIRYAEAGKLVPSSLWRDVQVSISQDPTYGPLFQQDPQAPRELFQRFVDNWNSSYLEDRATLTKLAALLPQKAAFVNDATTYEQFIEALLEASSNSNDLSQRIQQMIKENAPVSSAKLYYEELRNRAKVAASARRGSSRRQDEESSEDEGEIVEEGEDNGAKD